MADNSISPVRTRGSFRVWANLSLRVKLILLFLAMALLSVGTIAFLNIRSTSAALTAQTNENMTALAVSEARNIGTLLAKHVSAMQAFALGESTQERVAAQNDAYSGGTEAILSELAKLDEQWVAASDDDAFVRERLNSELAYELKDVKTVVPDFAEVFLTDRYGGLVAASDRTSDYYQADEGWWQAAYNDGNGAVFIALPELDESTGVIGIDMAVPVYDQSNEIIGIMRTTVDVTALLDRLAEVKVGETGEAHLLLEGEVFVGRGGESESFDDPTALAQMETSPTGAIATSYDGHSSLVGYATISSPTGEQYISDLGWKVFVHQDRGEALAAVALQTRNTALLALLIAGIAAVAAVVMGRALTGPIVNLTNAMTQFTAGDMAARAESKSSDEIGALASNFNTMAEQVGDLLTTVQARSADLEERTRELEASQRVTFAASERISPDEMLGLVVDLVRDQFDLYHAQVYIVDEEKQAAVLRQSTGYAGSQLLQKGHQIPLDATSLVSRAIHSGEPVLVADVNQTQDWLPNPLLPETQSELVVPLKAGGRVIGVLDAQDMTPGRFSESTVALFQTMADQVAFLFENSDLLARVTEQAETLTVFTTQLRTAAEIARQASGVLDPEQLLQQVVELMQSRFGLYHAHIYVLDEATGQLNVRAGSGEVGRVLIEQGHAIPLDREKSLVARAARTQEPVLIEDTTLESDFMPNPLLPQTRSELSVPLVASGKVLGVLDMQDDQAGRFAESDVDTYSTLAGQIATALQNADLFTAQQAAETRFRTVADFTYDWETWLGVDEEYIYVSPACERISGYTPQELIDNPNLFADMVHPDDRAAIEDHMHAHSTTAETDPIEYRIITKDGQERWVGHACQAVYDADGNWAGRRGSNREITMEKQAEVERERFTLQLGTAADIATQVNAILDPDELLNTVIPLLKERFGFYYVHVFVLDEAAGELRLRAGYGEPGRAMLEKGLSIPLDREASLVARAARSKDNVVVHDVTVAPDFMPNPLLPDTKSEVAVPMVIGERVLGVFDVQHDEADYFTQADLDVFSTLAGQVATALQNADLFTAQQAAEERFRTLFDFAPEGVMVIDVDKLAFDDVNERALELFGYTRKELLEIGPLAVSAEVQPDGRSAMEVMGEAIQGAMAGGRPRLEALYVRSSGKEFPVDVQVVKLPKADRNLVRVSFSDITERKQAEEELLASEARFRDVALSTSDWVWETDAEGRYTYVSDKIVDSLGYTAEEMLGKTPFDVMVPEEAARIGPIFGELVANKQPIVDLENWNVTRDGREVCMLTDGVPLLDSEGNLIGYRGVDKDITERKQAEEERERFITQLRTAADLAERVNAILDPDELLNEVVAQLQSSFDLYHVHVYLLDEERRDLVMHAGSGEVGQKMLQQGHSIPLGREKSLVARAARSREIVSVADTSAAPDFMPHPLLPDTKSEVAVPLVAGDRVLGVFDVQDNQVGRFTESDLDVFSTLAGQIATALQNAGLFEQVHEADLRKSEFLADMSHELRTPLNSIIGYTELMLMGVSEIDPETLEDVQAIYDNGKHLLRIINDILDLAKIEAGQLELEMEEVHIPALLDEVKTSNAGLLINKPVEILIEAEQDVPPIEADRVRVNQILNNLIGNAIKFTEEGSITMRAYVDQSGRGDDGWVCIEVQDTGAGMSEDDLQEIFKRFKRAGSSFTRRTEGTGLGLDITRHLVEMHGGTIDVHSTPDKGSTFTVRLPMQQGQESDETQ